MAEIDKMLSQNPEKRTWYNDCSIAEDKTKEQMTLKIIGYIVYIIVFTYCYYFLNRKLSNKWILIAYPLFFVASIYPIKFWFDCIRLIYGDGFSESWLKIILMSVAGFTLFNFFYGIVNLMVNAQVGFHQTYGKPWLNPVKHVIGNSTNIKAMFHFFLFTGGAY